METISRSELTSDRIQSIQNWLDDIIPEQFKRRGLDLSKNPIQNGYNIYNSYRSGNKTTSDLLFILKAFCDYGCKAIYLRTSKITTVKSKIMTLCDVLNSYVFDDGLNYIQKASNEHYVQITYHQSTKTFRLLENVDSDPKTAPVMMYVIPVSESLSYKSGFADIDCNIMLWDEFIDEYVNPSSTILFLNLISTVFRLRSNSVVFMNCNMSIGSPVVLRTMGIYEKVLNQSDEFFIYHTKKGMKISVTVLEPFEESLSNERAKMNMTYFAFDTRIDGIENITGSSITHEPYRELPDGSEITPLPIYFYACGNFIQANIVNNPSWQSMTYFTKTDEPTHTGENIILSDDKLYALETPYTYYSILKDNAYAVDIARCVRRNDVCYDSYMSYISIKSFYDLFLIPEYL